ncbi:aminopeptidase, putative [Trypanosoma brucei gambiense DAL972]|uniref:Aminopeptidase, putative n=1 Tax=Trypanosoma brucei gambiense (strain MHOM/CI/86/DAL972) TaxID=679716 RepID=D0A654_TRYB9|nr:aminopeptidase, putative [Trypanosoma brucei gambiense DAL972]CBH17155.1 aminopeptidase, putative [Trypanosoma brucei gambiense DAL972]|eukprot:XP_011779419.1 aminopeptidase, putative [Trypanosoma brucei gambiense DAL972]
MPATLKRQRSNSVYEESNLSSFVDSCVNFVPNVTFHTTTEGKHMAKVLTSNSAPQPHTILLLGTRQQLKSKGLSQLFPYHKPELDQLIDEIDEASFRSDGYRCGTNHELRITLGVIAGAFSRHNCPLRPDSITNIVKEAVAYAKKVKGVTAASGALDIYCCEAENVLCVAAAVARGANQSFSAKNGYAEKSYWNRGIPVRVVFAPDTRKQSLSEASDTFACGKREYLDAAALSIQLCQRLVDSPCNLLDTTTFTEIAAGHIAKLKNKLKRNVSIDIISGEDLREKGYGGIYGVGKAAEYPPHLVTLSYEPNAAGGSGINPQEKLAFVGKGIVYDTGGLSIKPTTGMCGMKHDMGGAAAVFCGFIGLAMIGVPHRISSILCLADNAVGPRSQRNDDIVRMRSGKTVEINNTDAEGRLVLGDGVYHASALLPYTPDVIVDMATLTGAQGIATGRYHAALYASSEEIENRVLQAGRRCGDLCFPVVFCPEFQCPEFRSSVADSRNSVLNRSNAQVSCAGYFVGSHIDSKYKGDWAHVDLAAPAARDDATGFGVTLLLQTFAASLFGTA